MLLKERKSFKRKNGKRPYLKNGKRPYLTSLFNPFFIPPPHHFVLTRFPVMKQKRLAPHTDRNSAADMRGGLTVLGLFVPKRARFLSPGDDTMPSLYGRIAPKPFGLTNRK